MQWRPISLIRDFNPVLEKYGMKFLGAVISIEYYFSLALIVTLILAVILWSIFFFYSVRRIEEGIVSEGKPRPCRWDPMGLRAIFYAWVILFRPGLFSNVENSILNAYDVQRYATGTDKFIAFWYFMLIHCILLFELISWVLELIGVSKLPW